MASDIEAPPMNTDVPVREPGGDIAPITQQPTDELGPEEPVNPDELGPEEPVQSEDEQLKSFTAYQAAHKDTPAEKQLEVLRYAAATQLPPDQVEGDLEGFKKQVDKQHLEAALLNSPKVAKYLEDVSKAPLAKDDLDHLGPLETAFTKKWEQHPGSFFSALGLNLRDAIARQVSTYLANRQADGKATPEQLNLLDALEQRYGQKKTYGVDTSGVGGWFEKQALELPDLALYSVGDIGARVAGGIFLGGVAGSTGLETGPGALLTAGTGAAIGQFAGSAGWNYFENRGPLYRQLRSMKAADGTPLLTDDDARNKATYASLLAGGVMAGLGGAVAKYIPGVRSLLTRFGGEAMVQALEKPGLQTALKHLATRYPVKVAEGAALMATQTAINAGTEEIAKAQNGQETDWTGATKRTAEAFTDGAQLMALVAGTGAGRDVLHDMGVVGAVKEDTRRADVMADAAVQSKLRKRSGEEFETAVKGMQGDEPTTFYATPEEWSKYWQAKQVDPGQMAATVMGDGGKAFADALATGGDLAIPAEKYLRHLAEEHQAGLGDYVRLSQEAISINSARESFKAKAREADAETAKQDDGAEDVYRDWYEKGLAAQESEKSADAQAQIVASAFRRLAERTGAKASELYRRLADVRIYRGEEAREPAAPEEPEALAAQPGAAGEGDASFEFGDNVTSGLTEARALVERMRAPEKRDMAAQWLDYVTGKTDKRPAITPELEREMARYGQVDPVHGYTFDEFGRSMERTLGGRRGGGQEPEEFRRRREANQALKTGEYSEFGQDALVEHPVVRELRGAFEKLSPEERTRTYYEEPVTGLLNERGFKALPVDPERPMVGHISVEGIKYRNDNAGHASADELYRAVAQALHARDPEAAKVGGDFVVRAKDWASFNQTLERVRDALPPEAQGYAVTGRLGKTLEEASAAHGKAKASLEASGKRAARGERPKGVQGEKPAPIPGEKVQAQISDELAAKVPADAFSHVYTEPSTGLLTKQGFDARPPKAFRASIDVNGLKVLNQAVSQAFGDHLLRTFGKIGAEIGGLDFDMAHDHGDEYLAQSDDREALEHFLQGLSHLGDETELGGEGPGGSIYSYMGVRFGYGIGETAEQADTALNAHKAALSEAGKRGDELSRLRRLSPEEAQAALHPRSGGDGLDAGHVGPGEGRGDQAGGGEGQAQEVIRFAQGDLGEGFRLEAGKGERGFITFTAPEGGKPRRFNIHLLDGADQSTFAHETAHFLAEVLGELATSETADESLRKDYQTVLEHMGFSSHEERLAGAKERRSLGAKADRTDAEDTRLRDLTAKEERFSHAWEQYLAEGKPPSAALAGVFARFRNWMAKIYRGIQGVNAQFRGVYGQDINLTPEVRGVFDRLLATDEEISKAQQGTPSARPFEAALEHMTPEERAEYERVTQEQAAKAKDELFRRITEGTRKENTEFLRGERERIRQEVTSELDAQPAYRALRYFQEGDLPESPGSLPDLLKGEDGQPKKLERSEVARRYGADVAKALPRDVFAEKGKGAPLDELAALLGWEDPDGLVNSLQWAIPRRGAISEETQKRLEDLYGPALLDNPKELAAAAVEAVHNPAAARKAVLELNALRRALLKAPIRDAVSPDRAAFDKLKENVAEEKAGQQAQEKAGRETAAQKAAAARAEEVRRQRKLAQVKDELLRGWDMKAAQDMAEKLVGERTVGEITAGDYGLAGKYERTERSMAARSLEAAAKGDFESAIAYKEKQLLNQALYKAARDVRAELEHGFDRLRDTGKAAWRSYLGKADPAYRQAHDAILQAIGLQELEPGQGKPTLEGMLAKADANAQEVAFDVAGLQQLLAAPKPWGELKPDEARNVLDAVQNIRHMARELTEVDLAGKKQSFEDFFTELGQTLASRKPLPPEPASRTAGQKGIGRKLGSLARGADATLANMETYAAVMDSEKREGPAHRLLVDARLEARTQEVRLQKQVLEPIRQAFDAIPKDIRKLRDQRVDAVGGTPLAELLPVRPGAEGRIAPVYTRDNLWMLFLNWGNEGNKQRVRDGNGWSDSSVEKALSLLTKPETDFLQGVLDTIETLYPDLAKVYEKRTGLPLGKVEATSIKLNGETYRGGYFPLRYDSRYARQGAVQDADVMASLMPAGYAPPYVASGHTKSRLERVLAPVDLNWGVVPAHLAQVIHDISYGDWVRQAGRIMMDGQDRWRQLTSQYLGPEYAAEFVPWLRDVANARADSASGAASAFLGEVGGFTRSKLAIGIMGLNVPSLMAHFFDPLTTKLSGVPLRHIGSAYVKTMGRGMPGLRSLISPADGIPLSPEMEYREAQFNANLRKAMVEMGPNGGKLSEAVNGVVFKAHEWLEHFTTTVAYRAAFEHALSSGKSKEDAVRFADDQVRRNFPSPDIADKPRLLREKRGIAAAVMFYGYANKLYNLLSRAGHQSPAKLAASALYLGFIGAGVSYVAGRGPDQEEDRKEWLARKVLLDPLNTIPFLGGIVDSLVAGKQVDVRTVPELAFAQDTANRIQGALRHADSEGDGGVEKLFSLMQTVVGGLGPVHQAKRTLGYGKQVVTGEEQPRGPFDVGSGLIYGKRAKQPANPLTDAQDLVSGQ